ncbi:hypothetical protein EZ449_13970 [Pedobacter frigidisoli]|uniref:Uncharacterized protein n=1 Tax=Pedobacter frigidisoli TaxID=2530455 RepID=A0A4R0NYW1_9SPHI|nr:hypothetical protein [Pedobacter frigidisoli]TCD07639.1 hypothetical protein EZ449_13970 [Pedobacter frigidisoli]
MGAIDSSTKHRPQQALRLKWLPGTSLQYGVRIDFGLEGSGNEVKYQVLVTRLKPSTDNEQLFQIERIGDVYVNEIIPDLIADRLSYEAGKVFYPLVISVNNNGGFESVFNHSEILSRWKKVKAGIQQNFDGDLAEEYMTNMEKLLLMPVTITNAFARNDWFINTFFKPIYKVYEADKLEAINFPILNDLNIEGYDVNETITEDEYSFGSIEMKQQGAIAVDNVDRQKGLSGTYEGRYFLHPLTRHVVGIVSDFAVQHYLSNQVKVRVFVIPENGKSFDQDFASEALESETTTGEAIILDGPREKSFWERLFNN